MPLVAFLCFIAINTAYGQGKNFSIDRKDPSWIVKTNSKGATPPAKDISDGYFLSLYENQNHVELQEEYSHLIREIVSEAGVQNGSQISVTYEPGFQKLIFHKILLWRNNQSKDLLQSHKFKVLQIEKDLSKFIYSGTYEAFLLLDDIRKGDRIEYAYTIKGNNPIFGQKYASTFYFEGPSSVGYLYSNLIFNKKRVFNIKNFNFNTDPKLKEKDGLNMYEWEGNLTKTHRVTDFEPSWYNPLRRTQLSDYQNWNEVVNWGLKVNDYPNLKSALLDKKVQELKARSGNNTKKYIELATRFVQDEIRYMGIEIGQYSHKPNSPNKVLRQRYGDCKDKSLLLVHLLAPMNVKADMAYVNTYATVKTGENLPSPFAFNHVVVVVNYNNNKTWIDPTISYQRGTFDSIYFPDYGEALVIKPGVNALEKVISIPTGKLSSVLEFNVPDTLAGKKASLLIKTTYTDNYADNMRAEIAESGTEALEKSYLEYYGKIYADIETTAELKVTDQEESNILEVTERYEISNIWEVDSAKNQSYVQFYADLIREEMRDIMAKNRNTPLSLKNPVNIEQTIIVHTPETWNLQVEPFKLETDDYYFETSGFQHEKTLTLNYVFRNMKSFIDGSKTKAYVKDRAKILDNLTYYISWGTPAAATDDINPYLIYLCILALIVSLVFCLKIYQIRSPFELEELTEARPIRGWLIFLGLQVLCFPLALMGKTMLMGVWSANTWKNFSEQGALSEYSIKFLIIIHVVLFSLLLCYSVLGAILFFKRRKNFPKLYIPFLFGYICFLILNAVIYIISAKVSEQEVIWNNSTLRVSDTIFCILWISYLKRSERVKETFVFTYPEIEWRTAMIKQYNEQHFAPQKENIDNENI
ncbi:Protein of unknown function [Pedobacter steynii]|uniref:DUF3857 domain-containing protein n=1 Tax=Pedobacter steynii TaxID=430522 RepID=A0A1H0J4F3_9SPHI|nr:Protein of unknown function [Pedobacter steynii]